MRDLYKVPQNSITYFQRFINYYYYCLSVDADKYCVAFDMEIVKKDRTSQNETDTMEADTDRSSIAKYIVNVGVILKRFHRP